MVQNTANAAQEIASGYATEGGALELGTVVVDGQVDPTAKVRIPYATLNRHGLVAGATGTGKTKTLQGLAGQLSDAGVPVLLADVKGDLSGMAKPGEDNPKIQSRVKDTGDDWTPTAYPVEFLSQGGESSAIPIRARRRWPATRSPPTAASSPATCRSWTRTCTTGWWTSAR